MIRCEELSEKIKVVVVGAGYWGTKVIEEYLLLSKKRNDVELVAVADESAEKLLMIGKRFSLPSSMLKKTYSEILGDPKVDGVHIATPNETHYEIASKVVAAEKNVLLEKPMCLTSSDAFKLARQAEKKNIVLLIGHIFRFNNAINRIKEMVEKKEIGMPRCVEMRWASLMPPPPNRDIIFDLAPHPIDILNHIFEEWPTQVYAKGASYERKTVGLEEVAFATLDLPGEIIATIMLSWLHYGPRERRIFITTESRTIEIEAVEQTIRVHENGRTTEVSVVRNNTIQFEIDHFVSRIKNNDPPINSALTGVMNVATLEALKKSMGENRVTQVMGM
jgi:UDP-N-acetylglucosamine 3-dehydrogenase